MNSPKLLLLQLLSSIPMVLFVVFYTNNNIYYLIVLLTLFGLLGLNIYRYIYQRSILVYPLLLVIVGSFYMYALSGLGSVKVPQSFESISTHNPVVIFDFKKPVKIDKMCYYIGIDKNVNFVLEYKKQNQWTNYYTYENSYPYSFRWKCISKHLITNQILLRVTKNKMMLNEVHFLHKGKSIPYVTKHVKVNDESNMKIDTTYYGGMYFDEIYHGRTAYEIMNKIWVYENTHPYLGKILLTVGVKLFGMTPFGWRISNVFFAGFLVFMAYYFALILFRERIFAFSAALLMVYSFMHFTQSRMAHIDTFGVLFVLMSYYFLYVFIVKQKISRLFLSGIFFGLSVGVKWSAIFSSLGFVAILIYLVWTQHALMKRFLVRKLLLYGAYSYGLVAGIVYVLTFPETYLDSGGFGRMIDYNINMYNYHTSMAQTHAYSSQWWSWPLDIKPMGYYKQQEGGLLSSISAFGNPAIFWLGMVAVLYLVFVMLKKPTLEASVILFAFLGLYLPYVFVGRLMFIYHFYYAVPFMMFAIIYMFKDLIGWTKYGYGIFMVYLLLVIGLFVLFYPVLSGYQVSEDYVNTYLKWFSTWWF